VCTSLSLTMYVKEMSLSSAIEAESLSCHAMECRNAWNIWNVWNVVLVCSPAA
jgi:hypothetical protein